MLNYLRVSWAVKFALRLFFKPLRLPIPKREFQMRARAEKHELLTKKANEFIVFELKGEGPKVLLIHGWSGRSSQCHAIADFLQAKGFHLFAIEAPGHGELQGPDSNMLQFVDAIEECYSRFGEFDLAIGHSLGGMALFNSLTRDIWFDKIVTIGSPASVPLVVGDFCKQLQLDDRVLNGILKYISTYFDITPKEASSDYLCQLYRPNGLIIHDEHDQDVPVTNARRMHEKWRGSLYLETVGLGHRKILQDKMALEAIYDFFKN
jgi:hypothetical protein